MNRFPMLLARVMVIGTLTAAAIIAAGLGWYLSAHLGESPGDHIFKGEPQYLENPAQMLTRAISLDAQGHRRSLLMVGVFLLLLNPLARVFLAGAGYLLEKDPAYAMISGIVFAVLLASFFW
ncbi:MAG: DUF1634 domain-containing protein [Verrucomicrobiae bacterium]